MVGLTRAHTVCALQSGLVDRWPVSEPEIELPEPQQDAPIASAPARVIGGVAIKRTSQRPKRVIAVSGAKGGAGKTVIASNLAIYLASLGRTTVVVDADKSGAHLHTLLGLPPLLPSQIRRGPRFPELEVEPTSVAGMYFVNGGLAEGNAGQTRSRSRSELFSALPELDCDYMVIDLGTGIETDLLDPFLAADIALYVTVPEPASVEGCYRFMRAMFLRRLSLLASDAEQRAELQALAEDLGGLPAPRELVEALEADEHSMAAVGRDCLTHFELHLVVNQTRVRADLELGESMTSAVWQRLGVNVDYVGYIDYDDTVWTCVRACEPLLVKSPSTKASKHIERLARRLISMDAGKGGLRIMRTVPPGTHHDLLEVDRGATDEEIRRAYRRVREVYTDAALCGYGLFTNNELDAVRARLEEAFDVLLDRNRRRPYELSVFPNAPAPHDEEVVVAQRTDLPPAPSITPETEFDGAILRRMRESLGLELRQISRRTKISMLYLQAIEDDDFGALPAIVYVRGFVSELAKMLGLDAARVSHTYVRRVKRNLGEAGA